MIDRRRRRYEYQSVSLCFLKNTACSSVVYSNHVHTWASLLSFLKVCGRANIGVGQPNNLHQVELAVLCTSREVIIGTCEIGKAIVKH